METVGAAMAGPRFGFGLRKLSRRFCPGFTGMRAAHGPFHRNLRAGPTLPLRPQGNRICSLYPPREAGMTS